MRIGNILTRGARGYPNRMALVCGDRRITYRELNERVNGLANSLLNLGLRKGDRIATLMDNGIDFVHVYFASAKIGTILVPVNFRFVAHEVAYVLNDARPRLLAYSPRFADVVRQFSGEIESIERYVLADSSTAQQPASLESLIGPGSINEPDCDVGVLDDLMMLYTSGTTGFPKGVINTHLSYVATCLKKGWEDGMQPGDVHIAYLPFFHTGGLWGLTTTLMAYGTVVIMPHFDAAQMLKLIHQERATFLYILPPILFNQLLAVPDREEYDVSQVRVVGSGGGLFPRRLMEEVCSYFKNARLTYVYGQTEDAPTTMIHDEDMLGKEGSCGPQMLFSEVRIVDEKDNDVPPGVVGQIITRGPSMMRGYWNRREATEETLRGGWVHSGDLGRMDEDRFIYLVDRVKDMIKTGGENVYPMEVEAVLNAHPKVAEAAVIGVPDERFGEAVKAFIILKSGCEATGEEIIEFCRGRIAGYKKPRYVEFVDDLPRTSSGKVRKPELRERSVH